MPSVINVALVQKAIADISECRQIHIDYAEWLVDHPKEAAKPSDQPYQECVGDAAHHIDWVQRYDNVLTILKALADA